MRPPRAGRPFSTGYEPSDLYHQLRQNAYEGENMSDIDELVARQEALVGESELRSDTMDHEVLDILRTSDMGAAYADARGDNQ